MDSLTLLIISDDHTPALDVMAYDGAIVYRPSTVYEALAMFLHYQPHATIFEGNSEWVTETLRHLLSVTGPSARGVDLLITMGAATMVEIPCYLRLVALAYTLPMYELIPVVARLVAEVEERPPIVV